MKNYAIRKIMTPAIFPVKNSNATAWSERLSEFFKAQLVVYGAVGNINNPEVALYGKENNGLLKVAMAQLQTLGSRLPQAYSIKYLLESGNHWRNLVKQMRDEHTDLMVIAMPAKGDSTPGSLAALMYNSPCPVLFVRDDMPPVRPGKILVPVRLKDGLEQKLPAVIAWANSYGAEVRLTAFVSDSSTDKEKITLYNMVEKMAGRLKQAGVEVESESVQGFHFGATMAHRAKLINADLIAIAVEPANFVSRLFTKMVGPYFLENSPVPVLAVPLMKSAGEPANLSPLTPPNQAFVQLPA